MKKLASILIAAIVVAALCIPCGFAEARVQTHSSSSSSYSGTSQQQPEYEGTMTIEEWNAHKQAERNQRAKSYREMGIVIAIPDQGDDYYVLPIDSKTSKLTMYRQDVTEAYEVTVYKREAGDIDGNLHGYWYTLKLKDKEYSAWSKDPSPANLDLVNGDQVIPVAKTKTAEQLALEKQNANAKTFLIWFCVGAVVLAYGGFKFATRK